MSAYRVCVIGGWCGNRLYIVAEHLREVLAQAGFPCQVVTHSVWENLSQPPPSQLILQLLPAYTAEEAGCPVINIKPLLADLNHSGTIQKILDRLRIDFHAE